MDNNNFIEFDWSNKIAYEGSEVPIPERTNSILVVNIGTALITVNGFPLNPAPAPGANGEPWMLGGHKGEIIQRKQLEIVVTAGGIAFIQFKWYVR